MEYWSDGKNLGGDREPVLSESRRIDFSRASHLDLFEQPGIRVFQQSVNTRTIACFYYGSFVLNPSRREPSPYAQGGARLIHSL
jgi:hypothetical protein